MSEFNEPWSVRRELDWTLVDEFGARMAVVPVRLESTQGIAERIAAAINHCAGCPTDVLLAGPDLRELVGELSVRNELLAAAEYTLDFLLQSNGKETIADMHGLAGGTASVAMLQKAIARAKGETL